MGKKCFLHPVGNCIMPWSMRLDWAVPFYKTARMQILLNSGSLCSAWMQLNVSYQQLEELLRSDVVTLERHGSTVFTMHSSSWILTKYDLTILCRLYDNHCSLLPQATEWRSSLVSAPLLLSAEWSCPFPSSFSFFVGFILFLEERGVKKHLCSSCVKRCFLCSLKFDHGVLFQLIHCVLCLTVKQDDLPNA